MLRYVQSVCVCGQTLSWVTLYREIFDLDNYSPIPVETEEEYKQVVSRFPFHDAEIEKVTFRNNNLPRFSI